MADYEYFTVHRFGSDAYSHPEATHLEPIREELNGPGSFSLAIPNSDPFVGNAREHGREIQVWRNGQLKWQGKIGGKDFNPDTRCWDVDAGGPLSYFKKL